MWPAKFAFHPLVTYLHFSGMELDPAAVLHTAEELVAAHGHTNVRNVPTDVSKLDEVVRLRGRVYEAWGEVSCGAGSHHY